MNKEIIPSIHKKEGWYGQYQRMLRWYNKFKKTDPGNLENPEIEEHHDLLYACFQNIFALKDWLINDKAVEKKNVYSFMKQNIEMKLCRDICNGTKHFTLKDPSIEEYFSIVREYEPYYKTLKKNKNKIVILSGGKKYDLKELAFECIKLWECFLKEHNILKKRKRNEIVKKQHFKNQ